jgi:hypothetical protein
MRQCQTRTVIAGIIRGSLASRCGTLHSAELSIQQPIRSPLTDPTATANDDGNDRQTLLWHTLWSSDNMTLPYRNYVSQIPTTTNPNSQNEKEKKRKEKKSPGNESVRTGPAKTRRPSNMKVKRCRWIQLRRSPNTIIARLIQGPKLSLAHRRAMLRPPHIVQVIVK